MKNYFFLILLIISSCSEIPEDQNFDSAEIVETVVLPKIINETNTDFKEIVKYDLKNDTSEVYEYGSGKFGAEPVFVAAEGAKSEDEGYLLSLVYNQETDKSDLIILNAKEPKSGPLATVRLPQRVPFGFHGEWVNI